MSAKLFSAALLAGMLAISGCAQPEPDPVFSPPVYDKYGNVSGGGPCVPADADPNSTYDPQLPPCEPPGCPPGQQAVGTAAGQTRCIPIDRGNEPDQPGGRQPGPNDPPTAAAN